MAKNIQHFTRILRSIMYEGVRKVGRDAQQVSYRSKPFNARVYYIDVGESARFVMLDVPNG